MFRSKTVTNAGPKQAFRCLDLLLRFLNIVHAHPIHNNPGDGLVRWLLPSAPLVCIKNVSTFNFITSNLLCHYLWFVCTCQNWQLFPCFSTILQLMITPIFRKIYFKDHIFDQRKSFLWILQLSCRKSWQDVKAEVRCLLILCRNICDQSSPSSPPRNN